MRIIRINKIPRRFLFEKLFRIARRLNIAGGMQVERISYLPDTDRDHVPWISQRRFGH